MIDEEAIRGVGHAEAAPNLGLEVNFLEEIHDQLISRSDFSNTKLAKFKSKFPA